MLCNSNVLGIICFVLGAGISTGGSPYGDSTKGIPPIVSLCIFAASIIFVGYVAIRVWLSIRKDKEKK